ncbi:hypothetical protein HY523_00535 [Candidatus Berkelbacteria bacterium]|nr:hypothetical protein [Candidatus Berkelbacteria bacterium]
MNRRCQQVGPIIVFVLLLGWTIALRISHIATSPSPFSLDPYFHMADSARILETGSIGRTTPYDLEESISGSDHLLPLLGAGATAVGIDPIAFYRYTILAIVLGIGWLWYLILRQFFSGWAAALGAGAYLSFPYLSHRTILTLPENLNLLFLLGLMLLLSRWQQGWQGQQVPIRLTIILILLGLSFFTHPTVFVGLLLLISIGVCTLLKMQRWLLALIAVGIGGGVVWLDHLAIPGRWAWQLPTWTVIEANFTWPLFLVGILGCCGLVVAASQRKLPHWPILLGTIGPILGIWLVYRGVPGVIEPERWLIFVGWPLVFGLSWIVDQTLELRGRGRSLIASVLIAGIVILLLAARPLRPWPQAFTPREIEAAYTLQTTFPQNALYVSQPIMEWLIRGIGQRWVIWDGYRGTALLRDRTLTELGELGRTHGVATVFLVFSRAKNDPEARTLFSDGSLRPAAFNGQFLTQGIDEEKFACLPKPFDNGVVAIYELATTEVRADCRDLSVTPTAIVDEP